MGVIVMVASVLLYASLSHGFTCPSSQENGSTVLYPSPEDCSIYYACLDSVSHLMHCPTSLYFDPDLGVCNYKDQVDCKAGVRPTTANPSPNSANPTPEKTTKLPGFICPSKDGSYPCDNDCKNYWVCLNSVAHFMHCPSDLYFDPELKVCNYKEQVHCNANN